MSPAPKPLSLPAKPLRHLQHMRQVLVNELPPDHDLRKRVQADGYGELLPEQPAGRPRALLKAPPARKRGREPYDPTMVLERRILMTMWNEKYHLTEDWNRVRAKMSENRKKLGMRERPYFESDSRRRSREDSLDNSSGRESEPAAKRSAKKRRRSDATTSAAGNKSSDEEPAKKKRHRLDSGYGEKETSHSPLAPGRHGETSQKSGQSVTSSGRSVEEPHASKRRGWTSLWTGRDLNLSQSPLTTSSEIVCVPDSSLVANDATPHPLLPTVIEVMEAIPASGMSMRRITELFWSRVHSDMDKFFVLLRDNTIIDLDKGLIRRKEASCEDMPMANFVGAQDQERLSEMTISDKSCMAGGDMRFGDGTIVGTRVLHIGGRSLARRGGLDSARHRRCITSTRRKRRRYADYVHL